jgi:hypothetical protein
VSFAFSIQKLFELLPVCVKADTALKYLPEGLAKVMEKIMKCK